MNLDEAVKHFNGKGLFAKQQFDSPGHLRRIVVAGQVEETDLAPVLKDVTYIYPEGRFWIVEVRNGVPVPIFGDFQVKVTLLEDAVNIINNRYFGKAQAINEWSIPIHRHPEWKIEEIRNVVTNAKRVTAVQWRQIQAELDQRLNRLTANDLASWFDHPELVYWMIASIKQKKLDLWMSKDIQQAYVVQNF